VIPNYASYREDTATRLEPGASPRVSIAATPLGSARDRAPFGSALNKTVTSISKLAL
jgi:hypothetical protein